MEDEVEALTISRWIPPHLVHRIVQYSEPDRPGMTRITARCALHAGQLDSTVADGEWAGLISVSGIGCSAIFRSNQAADCSGICPAAAYRLSLRRSI